MHLFAFCKVPLTAGLIQKKLLKTLLIMKFTALMIFACLQVSAGGLAQTVSLSEQNASLKGIFKEIHRQTGYEFLYSSKILSRANRVSISVKDASLQEVLAICFKKQPLTFIISEKTIVVQPLQLPRTTVSQEPVAHVSLTVTGMVTDDTGATLPGVNILVKGTTIGTSTDATGKYTLTVPDEGSVLVFSFIGYATKEVPVGDQTIVNVLLQTEIQSLTEVVVVGYGTQEKKDVTGSVGTIDATDLKSIPVASISDAIQGRAAGLQVMSSGVPGTDATFRIRGTSTFNNSDPLLVIDGMPVTSGLNTLNPDDIASINILKDASAASIYGARGANGVIIVTTKRGKGTRNGLNLSYYYAVQEPANMVEMLNAAQFADLNNQMLANNSQATNPGYADPGSLGEGTDWLGALFGTAPMKNLSVSYSGTSDKSNYYVSGNIMNQDGIVLETGFKRYTIQFNSDHTVFNRLRFGNNLTLNHDIKTSGNYNIQNAMAASPVQPILNTDGTYSGPGTQPQWYGDMTNPIGQARLIDNTIKGYNLIGSIYGEVDILENLVFKSTAGLQANFWDTKTWNPKYDWRPLPQSFSTLNQVSNKAITWLLDNTLTYSKVINDIHSLTVLAGTSAQHSATEFTGGYREGFASDITQQINSGSQTNMASFGNAYAWSLLSFIGRVNYDLNDKYLLTATVRRDGSSRFGAANKYGTFPSVSAAWRISQEGFFKPLSFIHDLKLRAGYGETGNQEIGNYTFASVLQPGSYNFNGQLVQTTFPQAMPNPNVKWETVKQANLGLDASLRDEKVVFTFDAFVKKTEDMLVRGAVPISTGYRDFAFASDLRPFVNAGKMENRGIEVSVNTKNIARELTWNTQLNFTLIQNKIVSLNDTVPLPAGQINGNINYYVALQQNGHPFNSFYGYATNGIFQSQEEVDNYATQQPGLDPFNRTAQGDIRFSDLNHDGVINDKDRKFIGNPNPQFFFGMNNTFTWKGFQLDVFVQGVSGNDIFNANRIWQEGMSVAQNQTVAVLDRWTEENRSTTIPRAIFNDPNKNARGSDRFIEDGSYLRIKNVTLAYALPQSLINRIKLTSARLYASGQNLYTFTKYSGIDPEVGLDGIDFNVYPVTRTYSIGVNMSF